MVFAFQHRIFRGRAYHDSNTPGGFRQLIHGGFRQFDKVFKLQKITRWIAHSSQLTEADDVRRLSFGLLYGVQHFFQIAFEVANVKVELCDGDSHGCFFGGTKVSRHRLIDIMNISCIEDRHRNFLSYQVFRSRPYLC